MKKLYLAAIFALFIFNGYSQYYLSHFGYGNPGNLNDLLEYPVGSGLDASWSVLLTGSKSSPTWSSATNLPFSFSFNGSSVTQYMVNSCGILTFDVSTSVTTSYTNAALPSSSVPNKSVCAWGIEGVGSNDEIVTQTFGSSPNRQLWVMFSSYTLPSSTSCYSYWAIVLEETTNRIYVVDMRSAGSSCVAAMTVGVQIDGSTAIQHSDSPNLAQVAGTDPSASDNVYYGFTYHDATDYDINTIDITTSKYLSKGQAPIDVTGRLTNTGTKTITSFTLNYSDGTNVTSDNITGVSVTPLEVYDYTSKTGWSPALTGAYTLQVWPSNINGNADEYAGNDTASLDVVVVDTLVQRIPLHEAFTSSTCGPCASATPVLQAVLDANSSKYSLVKYQMDFPGDGDIYYTEEGGVRASYYSISSIPHLFVDGAYDDNTANYSQSDFDGFYENPAFMSIQTYYHVSGQTVDMDITITPYVNYTESDNIMHIAIVEDTTFLNIGTNGETEFNAVMKKMVPDADGTTLSTLTAGQAKTFSESYTFQGSYNGNVTAANPVDHTIEHTVEDFGRLSVVVWVQNETTKEVYQSNTALDTTSGGSSIKDIQETGNGIVSLYPNPSTEVAYLKYYNSKTADVTLRLQNIVGETMYSMNVENVPSGSHSFKFNTANLAEGIYTAQLIIGGHIYTQKVVVAK